MSGFHGTTGFGRLISLLVYSVLMKSSFYEAISLPFLFLVPHRDDMEHAYVGVQNFVFNTDNVTMTDFGDNMEGINDEFIIVETLEDGRLIATHHDHLYEHRGHKHSNPDPISEYFQG